MPYPFTDEQLQELARRLAAAEMSVFGDLSLQHTYNMYVKGQQMSGYWLELATEVARFRAQAMLGDDVAKKTE